MPIVETNRAIGEVSRLLTTQLQLATECPNVRIGRPEDAKNSGSALNLFLYQLDWDAQLKNLSFDSGQPTPMWMVLRFLLTAYAGGDNVNNSTNEIDSDNDSAHDLLGKAIIALQELNFLHPNNPALDDNPEPLKITFDTADTELLSKLMQGSDEKYRLSVAFQIRPVMLASLKGSSSNLPVKTVGPPANEGVVVLPTLGPRLESLIPEHFSVGDTMVLSGVDLGDDVYEICIGDECLPSIAQKSNLLKAKIPDTITLSPGSYPVSVRRQLPSGRYMSSNALLGHLLPTVIDAEAEQDNNGFVTGHLTINGARLGNAEDNIFLAFYQNGETRLLLEAIGDDDQNIIQHAIEVDLLPPGLYRIIVRVNGEQALLAPEINWIRETPTP